MGVYASNTFDVTIPMTEVGPIIEEFLDAVRADWHSLPEEWTKDQTPETLGDIITCQYGAEAHHWDILIKGSDLWLTGDTYGKVLDTEKIEEVLCAHGVTGTVRGECEGEHFLIELTAKGAIAHGGVVVFPTYEPKGTP